MEVIVQIFPHMNPIRSFIHSTIHSINARRCECGDQLPARHWPSIHLSIRKRVSDAYGNAELLIFARKSVEISR